MSENEEEEKLNKLSGLVGIAVKTLREHGYSFDEYKVEDIQYYNNHENLIIDFTNFYNVYDFFRIYIIKENNKYFVVADDVKYELNEVDKDGYKG